MAIVNFLLTFGPEELGSRTEVYTRSEAATPFYQLASQSGLKNDISA